VPLLLFISGCMVGPDFNKPQPPMPQAWLPPSSQPTTSQSVATNEPPQIATWWTNFNDDELNALVRAGIAANLDIKQAEARIREARASRGQTAANLWPMLNGTGSYSRVGVASRSSDLWQAGLDATWELDIFGGTRRAVESADALVQAAIENQRDVQVTLTSEIAIDYLNIRGFQRQIVIAEENLDSERHTAELTRRVFRAGFAAGLDVANAEAQVATTASTIPPLETGERQSIYALSVLLARPPAALVDELSIVQPIPTTPPTIPVGLPSDLLRRRPDIRRAEANLHSANAQIGAAVAELFPQFSLTGNFGYESATFKKLFNWSNTLWSVSPTVNLPIFEGGRIQSDIDLQKAVHDESFYAYTETVLSALADVENSLIAYEKEQEHRRTLAEAVAANQRAFDISTQLYTQGQTDFLNVLTAERSLFVTQDALVQSDVSIAIDLVSLYKALGGGWEEPPVQHNDRE
jgi:NodT family efflux transporter outer membrane factor (OMF) lipoprotein